MDKAFDLRLPNDREALAQFLPEIDGRVFSVSKEEFIESISDLAMFLNNPQWMIYQWGALLPIPIGEKGKFILGLYDAIELGVALRRLSGCANFSHILRGFFNPSQFFDARFEVRVALFFLSLPSIKELVFSPEYKVRGRIKRPDFDAIKETGKITVECKSPNPFLSKVLRRINQIGSHFKDAMELAKWPDHLRLEINIIGPFREQLSSLATKIVRRALKDYENGDEDFFDASLRVIVVKRDSPFRLTDVSFAHDIMIVGETPTGVLNPEATLLRVTSSRLENQLCANVGNCIKGALKQLPLINDCLIFIEEVPFSTAKIACQRRLSDPAYSHIRAIGVLYRDEVKFIFRDTDKDLMRELHLV